MNFIAVRYAQENGRQRERTAFAVLEGGYEKDTLFFLQILIYRKFVTKL